MSELGTFLNCLYGAEPEGYVELRWRLRAGGGMGREFVAVRDPRLAASITARGRTTDLYLGVAPRPRQEGTRAAIERCHALFVDCDTTESMSALESSNPKPSMVIQSGTGQHAYWSLWPPATPDDLEQANRRLAHHLGADMGATDAARILRPPGTFNFKTGEPVPVKMSALNFEIYTVEEVAGHLTDPPASRPREVVPARTLDTASDPLLAIPPVEYVEALSGLVVGRDGKICCPFHDDSSPSLHVYDDPERGFYCYGCGQGGGIYQFAALMGNYPLPLRGGDFIAVRDVLSDHLGVAA